MKLTKLAALGAAAALALTACSNSDASPDTSPDNTAEVGGEVTVWLAGETDTPEDAVTWLKVEAKDQFDIDVTVERIGWGDLLSKVTTSLGDENQTPDIVELGNTQVQAFTHAGGFADITDVWERVGGNSLMLQGMVEGGSVDGALYAAPYYAGSRVVFYDTDKVKEPPKPSPNSPTLPPHSTQKTTQGSTWVDKTGVTQSPGSSYTAEKSPPTKTANG